jgi:SAM-dependent methyltransferase
MHEKRFNREIERLRDPERVERMEVARVVDLALAGLADGVSVVDVGIGSGLFAEEFARRGCTVTGVDVNPEMLKASEEFVPHATLTEGTAEKLPLTDGSADLVFMGLVLHETDDLERALSEARRVGRFRLAVLEWPYDDLTFGPPQEHRIHPDTLTAAARNAKLSLVSATRLKYLILFILE